MPRKLIKLPVVLDRAGDSKSEIYRKMDRGVFPLPVSLGPNSVAWYEDEIEEYVNTRPRRSRPGVEPQNAADAKPSSEDTPAAKSLGNAAVPGTPQAVPA